MNNIIKSLKKSWIYPFHNATPITKDEKEGEDKKTAFFRHFICIFHKQMEGGKRNVMTNLTINTLLSIDLNSFSIRW